MRKLITLIIAIGIIMPLAVTLANTTDTGAIKKLAADVSETTVVEVDKNTTSGAIHVQNEDRHNTGVLTKEDIASAHILVVSEGIEALAANVDTKKTAEETQVAKKKATEKKAALAHTTEAQAATEENDDERDIAQL